MQINRSSKACTTNCATNTTQTALEPCIKTSLSRLIALIKSCRTRQGASGTTKLVKIFCMAQSHRLSLKNIKTIPKVLTSSTTSTNRGSRSSGKISTILTFRKRLKTWLTNSSRKWTDRKTDGTKSSKTKVKVLTGRDSTLTSSDSRKEIKFQSRTK